MSPERANMQSSSRFLKPMSSRSIYASCSASTYFQAMAKDHVDAFAKIHEIFSYSTSVDTKDGEHQRYNIRRLPEHPIRVFWPPPLPFSSPRQIQLFLAYPAACQQPPLPFWTGLAMFDNAYGSSRKYRNSGPNSVADKSHFSSSSLLCRSLLQ